MILKSFKLQHKLAYEPKIILFSNGANIINSGGINSKGKTTLMRAILYTLGFAVPSTELVKFEDFEFKLTTTVSGYDFIITRNNLLLTINSQEFDLPVDVKAAHAFLFSIHNMETLSNLLGTIYFDQEKGWTLLNRGTIVGAVTFNVESFFRGLKDDESNESYEMVEKIKALRKKIAQYKLMLDVAEYQTAFSHEVENKLDVQNYHESLDNALIEHKMKLQSIDNELAHINSIIKNNKHFSDYIESKNVFIKNPDENGSPIRVNRETLWEFDSVEELNFARKGLITAERNKIKKEIAKIESSQEKQLKLFDMPDVDLEMTRRLANIRGINSIEVTAMLEKFKKEKRNEELALNNKTKMNNIWITKAVKILEGYVEELEIPPDYKIDIFTKNLRGKSGAILHKLIFAYKLTYIRLLSEKIGYCVPVFCDSPSGREVEASTIQTMLNILKRDFSNHQIFIASIYSYDDLFEDRNTIELDGTLFDKPFLTNNL